MNHTIRRLRRRARAGGLIRAPGLAVLLVLSMISIPVSAQSPSTARSTPPPVSGHRLSSPDTITSADVLSRLELLRSEVDLLRAYVGRMSWLPSYLEVEEAQPHEVYFQATNLYLRTEALAFQEIRRSGTYEPRLDADGLRPFDVYEAVDESLALVLRIKEAFGVEVTVGEQGSPDATTPTDVFNAMVRAESEIDLLLDQGQSASELYRHVTQAVHEAAALQAELTVSALPPEPAFEPNRTAADVETRLFECYELVRSLAARHGVEMLRLTTDRAAGSEEFRRSGAGATGRDLVAIIVAELAFMNTALTDGEEIVQATHPGRRVYSHVYQRAGLLELILSELNR